MNKINVKFSTEVTFEEVAAAAPTGYRRAFAGEDKVPGTYGPGIGGEPLVILLPNDDGAWFDTLVSAKI